MFLFVIRISIYNLDIQTVTHFIFENMNRIRKGICNYCNCHFINFFTKMYERVIKGLESYFVCKN